MPQDRPVFVGVLQSIVFFHALQTALVSSFQRCESIGLRYQLWVTTLDIFHPWDRFMDHIATGDTG